MTAFFKENNITNVFMPLTDAEYNEKFFFLSSQPIFAKVPIKEMRIKGQDPFIATVHFMGVRYHIVDPNLIKQ